MQWKKHYHIAMSSYHLNMIDSLVSSSDKLFENHYRRMDYHTTKLNHLEDKHEISS